MKKKKKCNMIYQNYETKCNKFRLQRVTEAKMEDLKKHMEGLAKLLQ